MTYTLPNANSTNTSVTYQDFPPLARAAATAAGKGLRRQTLPVGRAIAARRTSVELRPVARPQVAPRVSIVPSSVDRLPGVLVAEGPAVAFAGAAGAVVPLRKGA